MGGVHTVVRSASADLTALTHSFHVQRVFTLPSRSAARVFDIGGLAGADAACRERLKDRARRSSNPTLAASVLPVRCSRPSERK